MLFQFYLISFAFFVIFLQFTVLIVITIYFLFYETLFVLNLRSFTKNTLKKSHIRDALYLCPLLKIQ